MARVKQLVLSPDAHLGHKLCLLYIQYSVIAIPLVAIGAALIVGQRFMIGHAILVGAACGLIAFAASLLIKKQLKDDVLLVELTYEVGAAYRRAEAALLSNLRRDQNGLFLIAQRQQAIADSGDPGAAAAEMTSRAEDIAKRGRS